MKFALQNYYWITWISSTARVILVFSIFQLLRISFFSTSPLLSKAWKKDESLRPEACNFINIKKKDSDTGVFSCELCEIFKNTFFTEHLLGLLLNLTAERLKWEYPRLKVSEKLINRSGWRLFWALESMRKIEKHAWRFSYDFWNKHWPLTPFFS